MKIKINTNLALDHGHHGGNSFICKQALATLSSSLISFCSGLTFGITAVMLPQLRKDETIQYDPSYDSWIASISTIAMIFGSLSCGTLLDVYGRKATHIFLGAPCTIGWILIAIANSTTLLLFGRFMTGFSAGANKSVTMVYIGEIADPKIRAAALFVPGVMAHSGVLVSHLIGHYMSWKASAWVCVGINVASEVTFLFLKESPLWLIAKGRTEVGVETFRWFRGTSECSERELKTVSERQTEKANISVRETLKTICELSFIKPMLVLMVLMINIQFSGSNVISFYSEDIFRKAFSEKVDPYVLMIAMDAVRGATAVICCAFGKFVPRKTALLTSNFGVTVFSFGLVMSFEFLTSDRYVWVPVVCLVMYICFSSAILTIAWTFVAEVLPNNARGFGSGINATFSYLMLFAVVKTTPDVMDTLGESALFGFYGVSMLISGIILIFVLPETNGRTLQSIEDSYNKKEIEPTPIFTFKM